MAGGRRSALSAVGPDPSLDRRAYLLNLAQGTSICQPGGIDVAGKGAVVIATVDAPFAH